MDEEDYSILSQPPTSWEPVTGSGGPSLASPESNTTKPPSLTTGNFSQQSHNSSIISYETPQKMIAKLMEDNQRLARELENQRQTSEEFRRIAVTLRQENANLSRRLEDAEKHQVITHTKTASEDHLIDLLGMALTEMDRTKHTMSENSMLMSTRLASISNGHQSDVLRSQSSSLVIEPASSLTATTLQPSSINHHHNRSLITKHKSSSVDEVETIKQKPSLEAAADYSLIGGTASGGNETPPQNSATADYTLTPRKNEATTPPNSFVQNASKTFLESSVVAKSSSFSSQPPSRQESKTEKVSIPTPPIVLNSIAEDTKTNPEPPSNNTSISSTTDTNISSLIIMVHNPPAEVVKQDNNNNTSQTSPVVNGGGNRTAVVGSLPLQKEDGSLTTVLQYEGDQANNQNESSVSTPPDEPPTLTHQSAAQASILETSGGPRGPSDFSVVGHERVCPVCDKVFLVSSIESQAHFEAHADACAQEKIDREKHGWECPVCALVFPQAIMTQERFERHVQGHYAYPTETDF